MTIRLQIWLVAAMLALVTLASWIPIARNGFIEFDDGLYVTQNEQVQRGLSLDGIRWAFTTRHSSNWHPVTWLSHMLDCELFGLRPAGHHLMNLALHLANTWLLFAVLLSMTSEADAGRVGAQRHSLGDESRRSGMVWRTAFVAALFAIHPLHVESVAWAAERKDTLSTLFWLLSMAAYLGWVRNTRQSWWRYVLLVAALCLGLMAKPMLVTLPFVLLLLDYWPLARFAGDGRGAASRWKRFGQFVAEKAPLLVLVILSSAMTYLAQREGGSVQTADMLPLGVRVQNALLAYVAYLGKTFWPTGLAIFYAHPGAAEFATPAMWLKTVAAAALLLGVTMAVVRMRTTRPYLFVGWLWYLGTLVPVIGLVQVGRQAMADRYTYVPLIGIFILVAWGVPDLLARWSWRWRGVALAAAASGVVIACAAATRAQLVHWRDSASVFQHAIDVTDNNFLAEHNLALALARAGETQAAIVHFRAALSHRGADPKSHYNLGTLLAREGQYAEARDQYLLAARRMPRHAAPRCGLGALALRTGDYQAALRYYAEGRRIEPAVAEAHIGYGDAWQGLGDWVQAAAAYDAALKVRPRSAGVYRKLADVRLRQGKLDETQQALESAVQLEPDDATGHLLLADVLAHQRRWREAIASYRRALSLSGEMLTAANNLAWIFATHPDATLRNGAEAVRLAEKTCGAAGHGSPQLLDTLSAAYAEAGRFDDAVRTVRQAIEQAEAAGQRPLADQLRERLKLYEERRPFREG